MIGVQWKNASGIYPVKNIPTTDLVFGVPRPPRWWDEHPEHRKAFEKIRESIKTEGLKITGVTRSWYTYRPLYNYMSGIIGDNTEFQNQGVL